MSFDGIMVSHCNIVQVPAFRGTQACPRGAWGCVRTVPEQEVQAGEWGLRTHAGVWQQQGSARGLAAHRPMSIARARILTAGEGRRRDGQGKAREDCGVLHWNWTWWLDYFGGCIRFQALLLGKVTNWLASNNRNLSSHMSGGQKSEIKVL